VKTRTLIAATATAGLLGTSAFLLPAVASPHSATHTLKFTSIQVKSLNFGKTQFGQSDKDVNSAGKTIGFDIINGSFDPKTGAVSIDVSFDTTAGFMYFHLHNTSSADDRFAGKMTGGTGDFKHATGSLVAQNLNKSGSRTAITITYKG
jgi:hypothetical protein